MSGMAARIQPEAAPSVAVRAIDIAKHYGGVKALNGVSFSVTDGEIFGIIGPNGAGKSTLFDVLSGITVPTKGSVEIFGRDIGRMPLHEIARTGVARTFQRTAVFGEASVLDNLLYGSHAAQGHSVPGRIVRSQAWREDMSAFRTKADDILALTGLSELRDRVASTLAYGVQRRLAVAIALMNDPKILLLDEPAAGMNGRETDDFVMLLRKVSPGRTILIVEHDMTVIGALCGRVLVVVDGRPVVVDVPDRVFKHAEVVSAYLGTDDIGAADDAGKPRSPASSGRPSTGAQADLLSVSEVTAAYGKVAALHGVSLSVAPGEIVAILGANGAGKTTLLNSISGVFPPTGGLISFDGRSITSMRPWQLSRLGVAHVPEGREVFPALSVEANLRIVDVDGGGPRITVDDVLAMFPRLKERFQQQAGSLSGGEQQMLAIGRGLMASPRLILFDEPSLGLSPFFVKFVLTAIAGLRQKGIAVLLVEQNMRAALRIADRAYVLRNGKVVKSGSAAEIAADPDIQNAYLGA